MKFKKFAAIMLAATMMVSTSVSVHAEILGANVDAANTQTTDETLKIGLAAEPSTLWGAASGKVENESQMILSALTDTLVETDQVTGEIKPGLATAWEWVDDTHCKFTLRDDVTMSDGTPLVADDVVYSVGVWTEFSANTDTGRFLVGAEANDEHTVTIEFNQKAPDLLSVMAWSNFGIVSEDEVKALGGAEAAQTNPVFGCGKYVFKEWKQGQSITLERNDNYWNPDYKGYYKTIVLTFTNDAAAREMAVESGDAQVAVDMPVIQAATFGESEAVNVVIYDFGQVSHLWYNMTEGHATADKKVREAIDKCIDFDALANVGTAGTAPAALGYLSTNNTYYNETYTAEERTVDIEGAKALLEEAGYGDGLELNILGMQDSIPTYTVIQENLRAAGITLNINTPDTAQFVGDAAGGNYDLIVVGEWIADRNPSVFVFLDRESIETFVIGGPKATTDEMDSLIVDIIQEEDQDAAKEKIATLENMMKDDVVQSNLYPELKGAVIAKDLKGYATIERGFIDITSLYK